MRDTDVIAYDHFADGINVAILMNRNIIADCQSFGMYNCNAWPDKCVRPDFYAHTAEKGASDSTAICSKTQVSDKGINER